MATEVELKRGHELFKALLRSEGYEATLIPFLDRYKEEDNQEYSFTILLKYIKIYKHSEWITKEEIIKYNKLRSISKSTLLKRGKEICDTLIENRFRASSLEELGSRYASEDRRYLPYSKSLLDRMRKTFLETADQEYLKKYNEALELAKRSTTEGLDFDTLKKIINMTDVMEAVKYLQSQRISYESLRGLRNAYFQLYPDDLPTRIALDAIEELMILEKNKEGIERTKTANIFTNEQRRKEKIEKLKNILRNYINSGKDNLEECVKTGGYKAFKSFDEALSEEISRNEQEDTEFIRLYQKYLETYSSFVDERIRLAETLRDYYENGVYYGHENRKMSLYDYYMLTDKSIEEVRKILRTYISIGKANIIGVFLGSLVISSKFPDRESFIRQLKFKYPNMDTKERDIIIDYIEEMNWPYSIKLFEDIWERLVDGLIILPEKSNKTAHSVNKL